MDARKLFIILTVSAYPGADFRSVKFTLCDSYFETNAKSETYGARFQAQIWTVPSAKTGTLSMTYHNSDGSTTTPNWYAFSVQGANYLGAAAQASDFSSSQTQLLSLSLISSLPE